MEARRGAALLTRRTFVKLAGLLGLSAYFLGPDIALGGVGERVTVFRLSARRNRVCRACRRHARYKVFLTAADANTNRAHLGCNCKITEQRIAPDRFQQLFPDGETVADLRLIQSLPTPAELQGRVVLPGRSSFPGIRVILNGNETLTVITSGDGAFRFVQLVPGQYRLRAERLGYLPIEGSLDLVEGEQRTVDDGALDPGDLDESGRVDTEDLLVAARALRPGVGGTQADLDDDGDVDASDLALVARSYGMTGPGRWPNLEP